MSFDKETRNLLTRTVGACRRRLVEDVTDQLRGVFGLHPDGTLLPLEKLTHLSPDQAAVARRLRDLLDHYTAGAAGTESDRRKCAFERMTLEIAFTILNRLAALRLCEERGLVVECVRKGTASDGFQMFEQISAGALGGRYDTYRVFLECVFDELALDLGVLFDRTTPQSAMFPTERCIEDLLAELNKAELVHLWTEDETIGWIYQYFNAPEERRAMREASQAPRTSRELAVRNQFFTPRYVVEFLTDNTLGRIWYEMRKGDTALRDECGYLVRRPNETFLQPGERTTKTEENETDLSQEELLNNRVYIEHRPKKDPRDLRVQDPACGSGHFLLYSFDLLERIYDEAWTDPESPASETTGRTLRQDIQNLADLRRAVPKLIVEHNLHGIDIDPRAVQIAALALWLRAQKAWKSLGIKAANRPRIVKSNIVTAEPMPGEDEMRLEFSAGLKPRVLGQVVDVVFEKMKLAGEAGSLLKIEEELKDAVADARKQWIEGPKLEQAEFFPELVKPRPEQQQLRFDLTGVTDEQFWEQAEDRILLALKKYAEGTENGHGVRRRLFAEDAARGFALVDLCRKRYDVVLMNPPFGQSTVNSKEYIDNTAGSAKGDLYTAFLSRFLSSLHVHGRLGAITPRSFIYQVDFHDFRKYELLARRGLPLLLELGFGELDGATNRTAATILTPSRCAGDVSLYTSIADSLNKPNDLIRATADISDAIWRSARIEEFDLPESSQLLFRFSKSFRVLLSHMPRLDPVLGKAHKGARKGVANIVNGLQCPSDFRYVRLATEVSAVDLGTKWLPFLKPIHFAPYVSDLACVVNWLSKGIEQKAQYEGSEISPSKYISGEAFYPSTGVWFPDVSERGIGAALIPFPAIPGRKGLLAVGKQGLNVASDSLAGFLNSIVAEGVLGLITPERHHKPSYMGQIPWINDPFCIEAASAHYWRMMRLASAEAPSELSPEFVAPDLLLHWTHGLRKSVTNLMQACRAAISEMEMAQQQFDTFLLNHLNTCVSDISLLKEMSNRVEIAEWFPTGFSIDDHSGRELVEALVSYLVGVVFGRWDVTTATAASPPIARIQLKENARRCPPGQLQNEQGLPLTQDEARRLSSEGRWHYPLEIAWDGILVDDPGSSTAQPHRDDIVRRVREVFDLLWKDKAHEIEQEACEILGVPGLRELFCRPTGFCQQHVKRYSKSQRKAPIYWPLTTVSGSYTIWLYYHRLSDQILYKAVNQYVEPKIADIERSVSSLEIELKSASGPEAARLMDRLTSTRAFVAELHEFREELLRVAALPYRPDLSDGAIISAAPFYRLFNLRSWSKDTEECWKKLAKGEYDWAHLAYAIWPQRVREVCKRDRSVAIAHGLEDLCETKARESKKKAKSRINRKQSAAEDES
jgi:hypothetical protein